MSEEEKALLLAARAVIDLHKKHVEHSEEQTRLMREAAIAAHKGDQQEVGTRRAQYNLGATRVFSYEGVFRGLEKALKPFKKVKA